MSLNRMKIDIHLMQSNPVVLTRNSKGSIESFQAMVNSLKSGAQDDLSVFTVTMRELKCLVDATFSTEDD